MPMTFSHIETQARLRGKLITSNYSFPQPASYEEYRRLDAANVRAFGNEGSRTIGTIAGGGTLHVGH